MKTLLLLTSIFLLSACSTGSIKLTQQFWNLSPKGKVGIFIGELPEAKLIKEGQQGLLDVAISNAATGSLAAHLNKMEFEPYNEMVLTNISEKLVHAGFSTEIVELDVMQVERFKVSKEEKATKQTYASRDYKNFISQNKLDYLLVVQPLSVGSIRKYYGFIPTSAPNGYAVARGEMINASNVVLWRTASIQKKAVQGDWDSPPNFPNLSKAVQLAVKSTKEDLISHFKGIQ